MTQPSQKDVSFLKMVGGGGGGGEEGVNAEHFKVKQFIQALAPKSVQKKESNMSLRKG